MMIAANDNARSRLHTAILGLGVTGESCLRHLAGRDVLTVLDTRPTPPNAGLVERHPDVSFRFGSAADAFDFAGVDRVVVSPGLALEHPLVQRARAAGAHITSDVELFLDALDASGAAERAPVYAITGTNGKSTVTALAGHLLRALGRNPGVGGNLGEAALDLLGAPHDAWVLELSSFQLERLRAYPFAGATILNLSDDHLDRHGTMARYVEAKQRIYRSALRAVSNRDDAATFPQVAVGEHVTFGGAAPAEGHWGIERAVSATAASGAADRTELWLAHGPCRLLRASELPIAGHHNVLNALAALALVAPRDLARQPAAQSALAAGLRTFTGLPHRCVPVADRRGIRFVNDSKATNVGATIAALEGLGTSRGPNLVLIAGGDGKGADFGQLRPAVARHVKAVVLIGRDAPVLEAALADLVPVHHACSMTDAVAAAAQAAQAGDIVLLAPACASLDMYRNYAARGDAFAQAVEALR
ncbi:MAG: UDP-N-acetylmuramoyl-L-alanine--D-glutamate ligase [Gammaproteobacteria bacterium]